VKKALKGVYMRGWVKGTFILSPGNKYFYASETNIFDFCRKGR
jgi:hypothetical protein